MSIDCSKLFPGSHLHLLVWDRFDPDAHKAGLEFMVDCLTQKPVAGAVMPLLRPRGRRGVDYADFDECFFRDCEGYLPGVTQDGLHRCCELWLHVLASKEAQLWKGFQDWRRARPQCQTKAWRSHRVPLWQPLSWGFGDCSYCEGSPSCDPRGLPRYVEAAALLNAIQPLSMRAALLKLTWFRATKAIRDHWASGGRWLHPRDRSEGPQLLQLVEKSLQRFSPSDYGIPWQHGDIDPAALCVSHMTAFAANAVTEVDAQNGVYCLESYLAHRCVTRPYLYAKLDDYRASVEALM